MNSLSLQRKIDHVACVREDYLIILFDLSKLPILFRSLVRIGHRITIRSILIHITYQIKTTFLEHNVHFCLEAGYRDWQLRSDDVNRLLVWQR